MRFFYKKKGGITLIETIISIFIASIVMIGFTVLFARLWKSYGFTLETGIAGVIANAPGPIQFDRTCSADPGNTSCSKVAAIHGPSFVDTLDTVTDAGAVTTNTITVGGARAETLKLNTNTVATDYGNVSGTIGDIKRINEHPHYYDGTTWRPFYLAGTSLSASTSDVQFEDVQVRLTGETNGHASDYIYNHINENYFFKGGNATIVSSPTKFGTSAIQFDGSTSSYLSCRSTINDGMPNYLWSSNAETWAHPEKRGGFPVINGDWTIEMWVRFDDLSSVQNHGLFSISNPNASVAHTKGVGVSLIRDGFTSNWLLQWSNALSVSQSGVNPSLLSFHDYGAFSWQEDTWYHISISRRASDGRMFCHIDGTYVAPSAAGNGEYFDTNLNLVIDASNYDDFEFRLGENITLDATWTNVTWRHRLIGYLDDIRWTNFCRYNSNAGYSVPTQAYPIAPDAPPQIDPNWSNVKMRLPFDSSHGAYIHVTVVRRHLQ